MPRYFHLIPIAIMSAQPPESIFSTLITANHIIHYHNVVDAYGHVSVRNPANPDTFFMSGNLAPALVSSLQDLVEYKVSDASAVNEDAPRGYAERFIHSELYKKYRGVNSVIHSHAEAVIPFGVCSVPLRPVFHMGGVMGMVDPSLTRHICFFILLPLIYVHTYFSISFPLSYTYIPTLPPLLNPTTPTPTAN